MRAIDQGRHLPGDASLILLAYGGAINRVPADATAFVHRDELFSAQFFAAWRPGGGDSMLGWLRRFHRDMKPHASGFAYQNYIDPGQKGWEHAYYGSNWQRLVAVKATYDPENFFRFRQSIPTS